MSCTNEMPCRNAALRWVHSPLCRQVTSTPRQLGLTLPTREASGKPILQAQRGQVASGRLANRVRIKQPWELTDEEQAKQAARERLEDAADFCAKRARGILWSRACAGQPRSGARRAGGNAHGGLQLPDACARPRIAMGFSCAAVSFLGGT